METMDDYKEELEASFRRIREGDIISGTVIDVNEEQVTLDLRYYAPGIIKAEDISSDPDFAVLEQVHVGDVIEASVIRTDDGPEISFSQRRRPMTSSHGRSCSACLRRRLPSPSALRRA